MTNESNIHIDETTGHTIRVIPIKNQVKNFKKTSRNRTRSNFMINIQQGDGYPITGSRRSPFLKESVMTPRLWERDMRPDAKAELRTRARSALRKDQKRR